ncbi:MAG TPA: acyl-ACP thioesterase domain-containing protein [Candidatus Limnocylindrales bacterium]|jgi:acyl-CoA thioesterase FadM
MSPDRLRIEEAYRVRFDEATPDGLARTSALLGYLQDVAWRHSEVLGFDRAWYAERGLAWVVRAIEVTLAAPIRDGDRLWVSTRIVGFRRVMARRHSELRAADDTPVGDVSVDWAMTDGRAPVRVPGEIAGLPGIDPVPFTPLRVDLPPAPPDARQLEIVPRLREMDPMGHANNGVYLDWLDEAITAAGGANDVRAAARRYRVEYLRAAGPGVALRSVAWRDGPGWAWRLVDDAGDLARGRLHRAVPSSNGAP